MDNKRKKTLERQWAAADDRPKMLEIFEQHAPKEEYDFLRQLDKGAPPPVKEAPADRPAAKSTAIKTPVTNNQ